MIISFRRQFSFLISAGLRRFWLLQSLFSSLLVANFPLKHTLSHQLSVLCISSSKWGGRKTACCSALWCSYAAKSFSYLTLTSVVFLVEMSNVVCRLVSSIIPLLDWCFCILSSASALKYTCAGVDKTEDKRKQSTSHVYTSHKSYMRSLLLEKKGVQSRLLATKPSCVGNVTHALQKLFSAVDSKK